MPRPRRSRAAGPARTARRSPPPAPPAAPPARSPPTSPPASPLQRSDLPSAGVDLLRGGVEHDPERGRQPHSGPLHPRQRLQLLLGRLPLRPRQKFRRNQHLQEIERVIDRPGRQVDRGGQQRRQTPGGAVTAQQRRFAVQALPRQLRQPARRCPRHVQLSHPEVGDLLRPLQCPLHLGAGTRPGADARPTRS